MAVNPIGPQVAHNEPSFAQQTKASNLTFRSSIALASEEATEEKSGGILSTLLCPFTTVLNAIKGAFSWFFGLFGCCGGSSATSSTTEDGEVTDGEIEGAYNNLVDVTDDAATGKVSGWISAAFAKLKPAEKPTEREHLANIVTHLDNNKTGKAKSEWNSLSNGFKTDFRSEYVKLADDAGKKTIKLAGKKNPNSLMHHLIREHSDFVKDAINAFLSANPEESN